MTFVIGEECTDILDNSCTDVCPVDCIYTGARKNYVNPVECINCSACVDVCPVDAIYLDRDAGDDPSRVAHVADAHTFFETVLPGRTEPVGSPGGAGLNDEIGVDTELVAGLPIAHD